MPTTYAHFRLGEEVKKIDNAYIKEVIGEYPELFSIGLHGPDLLFYYKPLQKHFVNHRGHEVHGQPGRVFFENGITVLKEQGMSKAHLSYMFGVICHFSLDVTCHGYIGEEIKRTGISHAEIEMEFDRELLIRDGENPVTKKLTGHLVPSLENAKVIQDFYKEISVKDIYTALKGMVFFLDFLVSPQFIKRGLICTVLKTVHKYDEMGGLMMSVVKNPKCNVTTSHLMRLFEQGNGLAITLLEEYVATLEPGNTLSNRIYEWNFETQRVE